MRDYSGLFYERLPRKPYAGRKGEGGQFSLCIRPRETAIKCPYIQVGRYPHGTMRIVLDVDNGRFVDVADRLPPSVMVAAPGRAHVYYEFSNPFPTSLSPRSERLVKFVRRGLIALYRADPAYVELIAKNPVNPPADTQLIGAGKLWDASALATELQNLISEAEIRNYFKAFKRDLEELKRGLEKGRNVALFDAVRLWAYEQVGIYRELPGGEEAFRLQVKSRALLLNQELFSNHPRGPLNPKEVSDIAKSVSKWTWSRYRLPISAAGHIDRSRLRREEREKHPPLSEEAVQRGLRLGGRIKGKKNLERANRRRHEVAEGKLNAALIRLGERGESVSVRALAREAGVAVNTAARFLKSKK